jgi:nucleotide-binding universal stress UspA family protein
LAELEGATLHIVHIGEPILPRSAVIEKLSLAPEELRGLVIDQVTGSPAARIIELAEERGSALIVLCTHTAVDRPRGALGRVAEGVLRDAPCPVVLVQPERGLTPWALRKILLPHDGTPTTAAALAPAADLASRAGAELLVLYVAAPGGRQPAEPGTLAAPRYVDQQHHEWSSWASEFLERLTALGACPLAMRCRLLLGAGEPGAEIVRVAGKQGCNLIVLGWRGHLEAKRGLTMKAVIRNAACPVFVLRVER